MTLLGNNLGVPQGADAIFDVTSNKVFLPWRELYIVRKCVTFATVGIVAIIFFVGIIDEIEFWKILISMLAAGVLLPLAVEFIRLWSFGGASVPLVFDNDRVIGESPFWGSSYIPWSNVKIVALVQSMLGPGYDPGSRELFIYRKEGRPIRLAVPRISEEEADSLVLILGNIAKLRYFEFIHDTTEQTHRRIVNLDLSL